MLADVEPDGATVRDLLSARQRTDRPAGSVLRAAGGTLAERVTSYERDVLLAELAAHDYRIAETARVLGLERSHLYKKCAQLGIDLKEQRGHAAEEEG